MLNSVCCCITGLLALSAAAPAQVPAACLDPLPNPVNQDLRNAVSEAAKFAYGMVSTAACNCSYKSMQITRQARSDSIGGGVLADGFAALHQHHSLLC